jgi:predicted alpha/beta hydrolase family esterase
MTCLIIPGLGSSGPDHWQTRWERERPDCRRVPLGDWDDPTPVGWIAALSTAIERVEGFPILVAHSLGCLAVAWWSRIAGEQAARVTGALLVAPPDVERDGVDPRLGRFAPLPRRALPFPAILVASRDDPYADVARSRDMAAAWSADFHDAGAAGHINGASGLGSWDQGQALVGRLAREADTRWARPRGAAIGRGA